MLQANKTMHHQDTLINIGIDALAIRPGINGGCETYTREVVRHLGKVQTKNRFVVYGTYAELADWCAPYNNFRYIQVPLRRSVPLRILYEQTAFMARVQRDGVDVLFCPGYTAPLRGRVPVATTIHDMFAFVCPQYLTKARTAYWRIMLPRAMRRSSRIIAVSDNTAADIGRFCPKYAEKIQVIKEAADARFRPPADDSRPLLAYPYVLGVSTLQPMKNVPNLVRGYAAARRDLRVQAHLVLVGRDALGTIADLARELGVGDYVHLTGYVPFEELLRYYQFAQAFISASFYEGFGLPILEAMACGCPVVCSDTRIFREVAGDSALFFDPMDPKDIGLQIATIVSDGELRDQLRRKGSKQAAAFCWLNTAEQIHQLLCAIADSEQGRLLHSRVAAFAQDTV